MGKVWLEEGMGKREGMTTYQLKHFDSHSVWV